MSNGEFEHLRDDLEGLDEAQLRELIERASQIEALTEHPGWTYLMDYLAHVTATTQEFVLFGKCTSLDEYRFHTGRIAGLRMVMEAPQALRQAVIMRFQQMEEAALLAEE